MSSCEGHGEYIQECSYDCYEEELLLSFLAVFFVKIFPDIYLNSVKIDE